MTYKRDERGRLIKRFVCQYCNHSEDTSEQPSNDGCSRTPDGKHVFTWKYVED